MKKTKRMVILITVFICILGVFGFNENVYAFENLCRAYSIGVEGGEYKDETVCVDVDENGKASNIRMRNNSLKYYYESDALATAPFMCLNVYEIGYYGWNQMFLKSDCVALALAANGLPDDPAKILDKTEELLRKAGEDWNGSILTGDVRIRKVSSLNGTYNNPTGVTIVNIDCSTIGGEASSSGGCKNTEKKTCEDRGGEWYENLSDAIKHDSSLKAGLGTCYVTVAAESNSNGNLDNSCEAADLNGQGWWLCPTLTNATYTANWIDNMIADWLEVKTDAYGSDSATYAVWGVMRNVANVLMIILLLVIIFSQLTGFGINNYGIKKMLPRFVVMAILINLSFIICEIAVDLSNILGIGLRNLFGAIGEGIYGDNLGTDWLASMVSLLLGAVGIGGVASGTLATALPMLAAGGLAAPIIVVIVILALIPILISVLLFFVMLGARMIIVIGCIATAPIAFTLFILPNTQGVFKKWWSLFKAVLVMFPICGAVGGISTLIKNMVLSMPDLEVFMAVVGMIAPYLPFFALPSLLKGAIDMLGSMGAALTNIGERVRSGAKSGMEAIQRTGAYQDATKFAQEEAAYSRANRLLDRFKNLTPKQRKELNKRQQMRLFEAENLRNSRMMSRAQAETGAYLLSENEVQSRAESARDAQEFKGYTDRFANLTRAEMGNELKSAVNAYSSERSRANAVRLQAAISSAEAKKMTKELLGDRSGLGNLELTASSGLDARILNQLSGSSSVALAQYGRQMSKGEEVEVVDSNGQRQNITKYASQSLNSFAGPGVNIDGKEVSLRSSLNKIGSNALSGADDDTLEYIYNNGRTAASSGMLVNAATNASNQKELKQINALLGTLDPNAITFTNADLVKFDQSTVDRLVGMAATSPALQQMIVQNYEGVKSNPNLLGQLKPDVKNILDLVEQEVGQISVAAQSAAATQNTTSAQPSGLLDANGNPIPSSGIDIQLPPRRS
ncbi:hypothetical protein IJG89_01935 [Candidatus Saccharibacteria bacterium]|nr:hypothetical protein [Candidatus Saccharibacteria bacterium]